MKQQLDQNALARVYAAVYQAETEKHPTLDPNRARVRAKEAVDDFITKLEDQQIVDYFEQRSK